MTAIKKSKYFSIDFVKAKALNLFCKFNSNKLNKVTSDTKTTKSNVKYLTNQRFSSTGNIFKQ